MDARYKMSRDIGLSWELVSDIHEEGNRNANNMIFDVYFPNAFMLL